MIDALAGMAHYRKWDSGYAKLQSTRPQTLAYGLADSIIVVFTGHKTAAECVLCGGIVSENAIIENAVAKGLPRERRRFVSGRLAKRVFNFRFNIKTRRSFSA